jgi:hypothetical protein
MVDYPSILQWIWLQVPIGYMLASSYWPGEQTVDSELRLLLPGLASRHSLE